MSLAAYAMAFAGAAFALVLVCLALLAYAFFVLDLVIKAQEEGHSVVEDMAKHLDGQ